MDDPIVVPQFHYFWFLLNTTLWRTFYRQQSSNKASGVMICSFIINVLLLSNLVWCKLWHQINVLSANALSCFLKSQQMRYMHFKFWTDRVKNISVYVLFLPLLTLRNSSYWTQNSCDYDDLYFKVIKRIRDFLVDFSISFIYIVIITAAITFCKRNKWQS